MVPAIPRLAICGSSLSSSVNARSGVADVGSTLVRTVAEGRRAAASHGPTPVASLGYANNA